MGNIIRNFFALILFFSASETYPATQIFVNNVGTTLASAITTTGQTSMVITSSTGFPTIAGGDWVMATIVNSGGTKEIVKITAISGTTCTIARGQESTSPSTFAAGSIVSLRLTAGPLLRYEAVNEFLTGDGTDLSLKGDVIPDTDESYDIGSATYEVNEIFTKDITISGDMSVGTVTTGQIDTTGGTSIIATLSASQSFSAGVADVIEFDTESRDVLGEFNTSTYTFTPQSTGIYFVSMMVKLSGVASGSSYLIDIIDNSVTTKSLVFPSGVAFGQTLTIVTTLSLSAGDPVVFKGYCSDDDFSITGGAIYTSLCIRRIWD